jgi:hypothetical protein
MKAGRKLDALIAEKVMGWKLCPGETYVYETPDGDTKAIQFHKFSENIADAWLVLEKLKADGMDIMVRWAAKHSGESYRDVWLCWIAKDGKVGDGTHADTAPLAICLAALKAVGVEVS